MDITIPSVGESVVEALVGKWHQADGAMVAKDDLLCELETDKITLELRADGAGRLAILVGEGETVKIGTTIGRIEESADRAPEPRPAAPPSSPEVRRRAAEQGIDLARVSGSGRGGRVLPEDLPKPHPGEGAPATGELPPAVHSEEPAPYGDKELPAKPAGGPPDSRERRVPMSPIRKRIAERLMIARQQTAMLTTFNEADMGRVMELRRTYRQHYEAKFGTKPGLMPFFVKACCEALREFPLVNASIDGSDIVYHDYYDIGIAIGGGKGLVVPVLRDADRLKFREIDEQIAAYTAKVRENRLAIADLEGGTFTISNGGVYGSLLSTPIINPPQSAVLGMHAIQDRPVARDGQVVIRAMMYLALSYDHRLVDGRGAVEFLKRVKELVENPEELLLEG
jgi:2-oxoglutarate dehydrogenase E2 component (dihydrolipoamide succinyltransferase)